MEITPPQEAPQVDDCTLETVDVRNISLYKVGAIAAFPEKAPGAQPDTFYIHVPKAITPPQPPLTPIAQSYIDACVFGALQISNEFALNFFRETEGWKAPVLNDRDKPRYTTTLEGCEASGEEEASSKKKASMIYVRSFADRELGC